MFITVEMDKVDTSNVAITDVNGVYTGVQNVDLEIDTSVETIEGDKHYDGASEAVIEAQVYTVYDKDNYIIGAVAVAALPTTPTSCLAPRARRRSATPIIGSSRPSSTARSRH